ncbi:hypothetical protein FM037_12280 [Shewanella psychropiezotolerans]|uniref:Response regulatory domain-containing protein n=1 Tax=Shewanella psychropiezotolerans TaxID=2593655 RepID=A0ABX5WXP9_9GAMM|nr:hypothetical protein FM037_12280 [Shewanella psychropiezotolerans]
MPDMDGYEIAELISATKSPIVMLTARYIKSLLSWCDRLFDQTD